MNESDAGTGYVEHFPPVYDRFWAPYPRRQGAAWRDLFGTLAPDRPRTLLDVGCGTGIATEVFVDAGYRVTGLDISAAMLARARERLAGAGSAVTLVQADARDFAVELPGDGFTFALSTYDVPNHLGGDEQLRSYLTCAHRSVAPGGYLGFELATERLLRADVPPRVRDEPEALVAMWRGEVDEEARQLPFHLAGATLAPDGRYDRFSTVLVNTWYPVAWVVATAREVGWADVRVFALGDLTTSVADPEALDRVAIIARSGSHQES